jgi:hypothetical protein
MAIIQCIICGKRISSKAESCTHCGALLKGSTEEQLERAAHLQRLKKNSRLQAFSFIAVLLFGAGLLFWVYPMSEDTEFWKQVAMYLMSAGFFGYISLRVWIMLNKRKKV